jgi:hypothetical protein
MKEEPRQSDINKDFVNLTKFNKRSCSSKFPPYGYKKEARKKVFKANYKAFRFFKMGQYSSVMN